MADTEYIEEGYLEDQDNYIGWGPIIYWEQKVIVIPRNLLEPTSASMYKFDVMELKQLLTFIESSEMGMAHDKILYHETSTVLAGVEYAHKVIIINNYTITFENGVYGVDLYGANHNVMDVLNLNYVSVRSSNSAGLQTIYQGASGLSSEEHMRLMSLPVYSPDDVWNHANRTLSQTVGLTNEEHQQLMATPSKADIANEVISLIETNGITLPATLKNQIATAVWDKDLG